MAGQGCPPEDRCWLRGAGSAAGLLVLFCAIAAIFSSELVAGDNVELHLRASWGGGEAASWNGSIGLSAGTLEIENVLGVEADATGVAVPQAESLLRIVPRTPRTYDGLDIAVRAPLDAVLKVKMASATNQDAPVSVDIPLEQLVSGRYFKELDATGNRIAVHRTAGDLLRFQTLREHLVFEPGEHLEANIVPYRIEAAKETTAKCSLRLVSVRTKASAWQKDEDVTLDEHGTAAAFDLDVPLPEEEGVYELVIELHSKRFAAPLVRAKPLAERQVQLVVLRPQPPESAKTDWAVIGEFDPAQPKLWERMLRLPTMKMVPGLSKGPLGNEPTGTREHLGAAWSTLKPAGWQAYPLPVSEPGLPHILEVEFPSDVPQSLAISIIEPNAAGLVAPLGVDSGIDVVPLVGQTPQPRTHRLAFWPRTRSPLVLLANRGDGPAIFGRVKVLAGPAQLASSWPTDAESRLVAAWFDKPLFPENFSVSDAVDRSGRPIDDWSVFLHGSTRLADYLHFAGQNAAVLNVLCEGSSLYPSEVLASTPKYDMGVFSSIGHDPMRKDVLELLLRVFDRERLQLIPSLSFASPLPELEQLLLSSAPRDAEGIELTGIDGERWIDTNPTRRGGAPHYNVLDPRVQQAMRRVVLEMAQRYVDHPSFSGVSIQINGEGFAQLPDDACALDNVTLRRFATECRLTLPDDDARRPMVRWEWIQREARSQWLRWRAHQLTRFYRVMADDLRAVRPNLQLWLCPSPVAQSRRLASRVRPVLPPQDRIHEGLLLIGLDAEQLAKVPGLTLVRSRFAEPSVVAGGNPSRSEWNASLTLDRQASSFVAPAVSQSADPLPLRLEAFDKVSPFGPQNTHTFLMSYLSPVGAEARRRFVRSLAATDAHAIFDGGQMLTLGQEDTTRELLELIRSIPAESFEVVPPPADDARTQPVTLRRFAGEGATWFYLVNDSPWAVIVDVDLDSQKPLNLQYLGPGGRQARLPSTASRAHWKVRLQPYDLAAARVSAGNVAVQDWRTQVDPAVDASLHESIRDIRLRANSIPPISNLLRSGTPLESLANASFEAGQARMREVPSWSSATGAGITVDVDRRAAKDGGSSLHVVSRSPTRGEPAPVVWVRSDSIPIPATGRLAVSVWLKTPDAKRQPKLRLAIEGKLDGQPYYRRANVGASEDGRAAQPLTEEWSPFVFPVDDLPVSGLTELQIGFDLMDEGELWIDHVQIFDLWFYDIERDSLLKSIALADFQVQEGKVSDSLRFTESYWSQFLREHVSLDAARVATAPQRPAAPAPEPAKQPGMMDGIRRLLPRNPFQK